MKKILYIFCLFNFCFDLCSQDSLKTKKILIVATNVAEFGTTGNGSLSWEIAFPFQYFTDSNYGVDIVTPKGGKVAIYDLLMTPELKTILDSDLFKSKIKKSLTPADVSDSDYVAVFYPGGYGQFVDVVHNTTIAKVTANLYEKGALIGTTGHGSASLVDIKLSSSRYFVEGKTMTCFPLWMEKKMRVSNFGMGLPFDMESVLSERGATLVFCPKDTNPVKDCLVIVDKKNRLITGRGASEAVAEEMISFLKNH